MSESSKVFIILLNLIMFTLCFYWKSKVKKANKLLGYYVDESYYCNNCEEGDDSCQCEEVKSYLAVEFWNE